MFSELTIKRPFKFGLRVDSIAVIRIIQSPFQFSKCRNSRVKTMIIATIDAITMAPGLQSDFFGRIDVEFGAD